MSWRNSTRRWWFVAMLAAALTAGVVGFRGWQQGAEQRLLAQANNALARGDATTALERSDAVLKFQPDSAAAARMAADAARKLGFHQRALGYLTRLEPAGQLTAADCSLMGELWLLEGKCSSAEASFSQAITLDPALHRARARLIQLLSIECRTREALTHRHYLLRRKVWSTEDLLYMAKPDDLMESLDLDIFLKNEPSNPHLLLAKARKAKLIHRFDEANTWIDRALRARPDFVAAHAERGMVLLEQGPTDESLAKWQRDLPPAAEDDPEIWLVRGMWAKMRNESSGAARCFAETLRRAPDYRLALYQLSLVLSALDETELAAKFSSRVSKLDELGRAADDVYDASSSTSRWQRVANLLESLGRFHEAAAWNFAIAGQNADKRASDKAEELSRQVTRDSPLIAANFDPVLRLDLEKYPLPSFAVRRSAAETSSRPGTAHAIHFSEMAHSLGLDFAFVGADQPVRRVRRIFEILGSGVAIIDFDLDGWPDIYAAQGTPLAQGRGNSDFLDQLFRNREGKRFERVTQSAGLGDDQFSQGVSVGDFNNDGFPDLYVANLGENRLYQNNGDGTFSDVTARAGITGAKWTTSCALADLNGDSWPDIYEVTYLGGREIYDTLCDDPNSRGGPSCRPRDFPSEPDRFYLNNGQGEFTEFTNQAGFNAPDGKGLGIVVGDFDGQGLLSVFVANDTTANHFYCNRSLRGSPPIFENRADLVGLAYDRDGLTQACMGVAIDDADDDGDLDIFVTNFFDESNTLYRGSGSQSFVDVSRETGLYAPSLPMLGFGTQFVDADLDGDPDLIVTNGHITSENHDGSEFQMRPQFFENLNGRFVERSPAETGPYFERKMLGRALARLDFDRNGLEDIAVSHLDAPLALLHNDSPSPGNFLSIRLVGTQCDRDAIGTTVTVTASNGRRRVRQLTAGDGYECSNEHTLTFGLGVATVASRIVVRWPSGAEQQFIDVPANRHLIIVEGRATAY